MKNPNIIFFLIDGLRADQIYGENKTSATPNIDSLRKKGLYFTNAFSSVDGTIVSLNTIFSSKFQVGDAARTQRVMLQEENLLDVLTTNGYHVYGALPDFGSFKSIISTPSRRTICASFIVQTLANILVINYHSLFCVHCPQFFSLASPMQFSLYYQQFFFLELDLQSF